ncbi:hypothetical protein OG898_14365 [Streptomyces sp. NBC_00193]|uniref:hypothetical protein n=1 Tax=unclassified Streptomyces TaxID=2593676 RepID=UPI002257487A|nr:MULTISPECIES: hypothetical protein [unclassified Streptomyces]MCX5124405.1 hypothetical protein [Streptomyces sp. NBC_00347]MCX5297652.1 hypothetical protein [Streptomyces sp. NBC_00193]
MTTRRMYFATAALSALALGVAMASGWGQDFPDGDSPGSGSAAGSGSGFSLSAWAADWVSGTTHVEANVQHADVTPRPAGDIIWN